MGRTPETRKGKFGKPEFESRPPYSRKVTHVRPALI